MRKTGKFSYIIGILSVLLLIFCIGLSRSETPENDIKPYQTATCGDNTVFTDNINGYRITVPADVTVDDSRGEICMILSNQHLVLKAFREDFPTEEEIDSSIHYSNYFLENHSLFPSSAHHTEKVLNFEITYDVWSREAFTKVSGDKPFYACASYKKLICKEQYTAYTLLFQYDEKVSFEEDILPIIHSLRESPQTYTPEPMAFGKAGAIFSNETTQQFYDNTFGDSAPLTWGIFDPRDITTPEEMQAFEEELNYHFPVHLFYTDFNDTKEPQSGKSIRYFIEKACQSGKIIELTLQTMPETNGENQMFETLQGKYDSFLHKYARFVAKLKQPVLFRLGNEMNGDWCAYCAFHTCRDADIYCDFYRYIHAIFEAEGADNAIWIWNPNHRSFPDYKWNHEIMYYPGDEYVDVVGLTAYNTGNYYEGEYWNSFSELYSDLYNTYQQRYRQPLMITEFACSSYGGDKVQWLKDMFRTIQTYPQIKVAVWWNSCDYDGDKEARPYYINEQTPEFETFKEGLRQQ